MSCKNFRRLCSTLLVHPLFVLGAVYFSDASAFDFSKRVAGIRKYSSKRLNTGKQYIADTGKQAVDWAILGSACAVLGYCVYKKVQLASYEQGYDYMESDLESKNVLFEVLSRMADKLKEEIELNRQAGLVYNPKIQLGKESFVQWGARKATGLATTFFDWLW